MSIEDKIKYTRAIEQLNFLKGEFDEHVIDTSRAIRETREDIKTIEKRSIVRTEQMNKLDSKLDKIFEQLNDSKYSNKKGLTTQTIENSERISILETEAKAWKRASVIIGGLIGSLGMLIAYFWKLFTQVIKN